MFVRCDSETPLDADSGWIKEQLFPATIIGVAADITYPDTLAPEQSEIYGSPVLLTVIECDPDTGLPAYITPELNKLYIGPLLGDVAVDASGSGSSRVEGRARVVAVPLGGSGGGSGLTITGTDESIVRMDGTSSIQDSPWFIADDGSLTHLASNTSGTPFISIGTPSTFGGNDSVIISSNAGQVYVSFVVNASGPVNRVYQISAHHVSHGATTPGLTVNMPSGTAFYLKTSTTPDPKYGIWAGGVSYTGYDGTFTVKVGGVDKTCTVRGGIITDVS